MTIKLPEPGPGILGPRKLGCNVTFPEGDDIIYSLVYYDPESKYVPLNEEDQQKCQELFDIEKELDANRESIDDVDGNYFAETFEDDDYYEEVLDEDEDEEIEMEVEEVVEDEQGAAPAESTDASTGTTTSTAATTTKDNTSSDNDKANKDTTSIPSTENETNTTTTSTDTKKKRATRLRRPPVRNNSTNHRVLYVHSAARENSARPKIRRKHSNDDFEGEDLDDDSIGWVQPEWTKKLTLRSSDKGSALRKGQTNLANPITHVAKDPTRDLNAIANPTILRSTKEGQNVRAGTNLSRPITKIAETVPGDTRLSWKKPDWTKNRTLKPTKKGEELKEKGNLARPITFPNGKN